MNKNTEMKRFTLSLPHETHIKLTDIAAEQGVSSRDIMLKSLKLGLLAMSLDKEPNKELIIKETTEDAVKETKILFF